MDDITTVENVLIFFFSKGKIKGETMYFMGKVLNICRSRGCFTGGCDE